VVSVTSPLSVEPPWIVHELSSQWFLPTTVVAQRLTDLHRVVDGMVSSGTFLLAPPLFLGRPDHPVFRALCEHVRARHRDDPTSSFDYWDDVGSPSKVIDLLRLPARVLDEFPMRGRMDLLNEVQPWWRFPYSQRGRELGRLKCWLGTYGPDVAGQRRRYVVSPAGRVSSVEKWLVACPGRLEPFGYSLSLDPDCGRYVGVQVRLDDRSTVDLVGKATRDMGPLRAGDYVAIALSPTSVDLPALDRLMRHVYTLRRRITTAAVHGLLIADGRTVGLHRALAEQGFDYVSLSELGYREHLAKHPDIERELETSDESAPHPTSLEVDLPV
jgi:hypothetical protein